MKQKRQVVDLQLYRHHTTEKGVKVSLTDDEKKAVWLPLASIEIEEERGRVIEAQVPYDLAYEKGLI